MKRRDAYHSLKLLCIFMQTASSGWGNKKQYNKGRSCRMPDETRIV